MNKPLSWVVIVIAVIVSIGAFALWVSQDKDPITQNQPIVPPPQPVPKPPVSAVDPLNATYVIDNVSVTLVNGSAKTGSGGDEVTTTIFGQPVMGDVNGDGKDDSALFITQRMGGTGVFYYVVVAIHSENGTRGTNAGFLGDRIAPQNVEINDGHVIANYADRKAGEPMATAPTVGVSAHFTVDGFVLKKVVAPIKKISFLTKRSGIKSS